MPRSSLPWLFGWVAGVLGTVPSPGAPSQAQPPAPQEIRLTPADHPGVAVYQKSCVKCHGADGQGVKGEYEEPLAGNRSLESLAGRIERTMPEDEPELCVGEDARQVADFIYREFYSLEARQKKGLLPRIELARLTVPQYQNAVADVLLQLTPDPGEQRRSRRGGRRRGGEEQPEEKAPIQPGLRATYFQSEGMNKANEVRMNRVDARVDFDFAKESPAENIPVDQFAIIWQGSLIANETGHYEFRLRTQNGARFYLNSEETEERARLRDDSSVAGQAALIDAWVSSGEMREETVRVFLLGGRRYPLRLEFFKYKEETASIRFEWKRPNGAWTLLDGNYVNTDRSPRTFVVDAPFPPDDRSLGYERGTALSQTWHEATVKAAIATATEVVNRLPILAGVNENSSDREAKLKEFVTRFASVAFRRPLTEEESSLFGETLFAGAANPEAAVRRAVILILTSPNFLYTDLTPAGEAPGPFAVATRLSLALWDSIPDRALFEAARQGELATAEQVQAHARRMLEDPRAHDKVRRFFNHWLEIEDRDLSKDRDMFPEFTDAVVSDLRHSLDLFLESVVWSETSDYRQLLLGNSLMLNQTLRGIYQPEEASPEPIEGTDAPAEPDESFQTVVFPPDRRAGLLTHPYLLSAFAYHNNSSPIHRGVFLTRNIVGRELKPPPMAVAFKDDEFSPDATMREKITQLTRDQACMSCHSVINPLGFALENFDAVGRWRTVDNNKPIDSKSEYVTEEGDKVEVASARDVAEFAVASPSAHRAFVVQLFQHLVKQAPAAYGWDAIDQWTDRFAKDDFNIQDLLVDIAVLSARYSPVPHETLQTASDL